MVHATGPCVRWGIVAGQPTGKPAAMRSSSGEPGDTLEHVVILRLAVNVLEVLVAAVDLEGAPGPMVVRASCFSQFVERPRGLVNGTGDAIGGRVPDLARAW